MATHSPKRCCFFLLNLLVALQVCCVSSPTACAQPPQVEVRHDTEVPVKSSMVTVRLVSQQGKASGKRTGRILARAPDGTVLLETRSGALETISGAEISGVPENDGEYVQYSPDEMSAHLLEVCGSTFTIHRTGNFVICSDASDRFTKFVGRLLQRVVDEYEEFFAKSKLKLQPLPNQLPVIIFRSPVTFQEFAQRQHPDTDFSDVPGYYSVQFNQMLVAAPAGDREFRSDGELLQSMRKNLRQVETIVHEAVHQLTFNSGLLRRYAQNPVWLSEGLAVYFEYASGRGNVLWSGPGGVSRIHLPGFKRAQQGETLRLPLPTLCATDDAFYGDADQFSDSYAVGWALTYYLVRTERDRFDAYLELLSHLKPYESVSREDRLAGFQSAIGSDIPDLQRRLLRYMQRLRVR